MNASEVAYAFAQVEKQGERVDRVIMNRATLQELGDCTDGVTLWGAVIILAAEEYVTVFGDEFHTYRAFPT